MPGMQSPPHARRKEEGRSQVLQVPEMRAALFGRLEHVAFHCPCWVIAEIADVNPKTAQFWFDRCLDAATEWSMGSKLSGHVWIDEMRFAPTRASGLVDGVWTTYAGKIARDAYLEVAFDSNRRAFCHLYSGKLGSPTKAMVTDCLSGRIEPKSLLTHDGAGSHSGIVKELSLRDDWVKFVAGDEEYERKMKLMSNCCSYLRHCFESHNGIKFSKLEAYGNFFLYRWSHVRKRGRSAGRRKATFRPTCSEKARWQVDSVSFICWYI